MKLIGALLIIVSSSLIGFLVANHFILRPKQLRELQTALQMLETEISYGVTPLPQAFDKLATTLSTPIADIFLIAKEKLDSGLTVREAWKKAVNQIDTTTALIDNDMEVLLDLGHNLGQSTSDDQLKYLNLTQHKLDGLYQEAFAEKDVKAKLWRYLGVLTGLFLAILIM